MTRSRRLLLALATLLGACTLAPATRLPGGIGEYRVGRPFVDWLEERGGEDVFGVAIGPERQEGMQIRQAFSCAELIYDTAAPEESQIRLAPLGRELGLASPPVPPLAEGAARYFAATGHNLHPDFAEAFDRIGGRNVAGSPIAEAEEHDGLLTQAFENLGMVLERTASGTEVRLLGYGLAARGGRHSVVEPREGPILPSGLHQRPFAAFLDRYGGEAFFGRSLTEPYTAADGLVEQVFERAVLAAPEGQPELARLRPLGLQAGPTEPPVDATPGADALYFPMTGHNVLPPFADFYREHDGWQLFGPPLEEAETANGVLVQRFENVVLEHHQDLPNPLAVQLAPLGSAYLQASMPPTPTLVPPSPLPTPSPAQPTVEVRTWVESPVLPRGRVQQVYIQVYLPDGSPWAGVLPIVEVEGPRTRFVAETRPTGADGLTQLEIVIEDLRPGEIVTYEVFVSGEYGIGYDVGAFIAELED